jgi:maleate isomerase
MAMIAENEKSSMRGWRGRIGIVSPDDGIVDDEYWRFVPDGVNVLVTRYTTAKRDESISPDMVDAYADLGVLKAAADTLRITRPGAIGFACNSCSFVRGRGWDIKQGEAIGEVANAPGTTISSAMIQALRLYGARKVSISAPYPAAVTERLRHYFGEHGIDVAAINTAELSTEWQIGNTPPGYWYMQGRAVDRPESDVVVIACSGTRTAEIIADLEADLGKPVISATQLLMWHCLQLMHVDATSVTRGSLFGRFGLAFRDHGVAMLHAAL